LTRSRWADGTIRPPAHHGEHDPLNVGIQPTADAAHSKSMPDSIPPNRHRPLVALAPLYRPTFEESYWSVIADFTLDVVARASRSVDIPADQLAVAAAPFVLWAWQSAAEDLAPDIFRTTLIERYVAEGMPGYRTRAGKNTIRSRLQRISEHTNPSGWDVALRPLGPSDPSRPYSNGDIAAMRSWAQSERTDVRRNNAAALLALGMGAGLQGREILGLKLGDIYCSTSGVDVIVREGRARRVPVLREWESALRGPADTDNWSTHAFRPGRTTANENLITDFVSRSRGRVHVNARRMRATWIVRHLDLGTPPIALLRAAGVHSLDAIDRYVRFAASRTDDHALRGYNSPTKEPGDAE